MPREICIHNNDVSVLVRELRFVIQYFLQLGHTECEVVFGWRWGMGYPAGEPWAANVVRLDDLETEIQKPELAGHGQFGHDDIEIRIPSVNNTFVFCHHSGIHLNFETTDSVSSDFRARWLSLGFKPIERDNSGDF